MEGRVKKVNSIDSYISQFPAATQKLLKQFRAIVSRAAPKATETIAYQIPTFYLNGNLVHFAAYESHIGFYPTPSAIRSFKKELAAYKTSKGAVQFPIDEPLPENLIKKMVRFKVKENMEIKKAASC
ncbi:MAG: DUF1801 domain-containing protein [Fibrobacteres bacterium]|nr:DUF1801 domain-containing protein [Fibrobacterota bacterium]